MITISGPSIAFWDLISFKSLWEKDFGFITKHKALEMQLMRDGHLFGFTLETYWSGSDHAGPHLSVSLFFHTFDITLYDSRHWNHDADRWETPEEQEAWTAEWEEKHKQWETANLKQS